MLLNQPPALPAFSLTDGLALAVEYTSRKTVAVRPSQLDIARRFRAIISDLRLPCGGAVSIWCRSTVGARMSTNVLHGVIVSQPEFEFLFWGPMP
jgi:hypothetical protein